MNLTVAIYDLHGQLDEAALLLKSIVDNKISFQKGKKMGKFVRAFVATLGILRVFDLRDSPSPSCCP